MATSYATALRLGTAKAPGGEEAGASPWSVAHGVVTDQPLRERVVAPSGVMVTVVPRMGRAAVHGETCPNAGQLVP
ncbi:hypothetical protein ADL30_00050 [Streptomyces sp. NRRL S-1521]|nr:hypothetical protein ADL30_00050 [Streptomyces sp. NRRL S-1521]